MDSIFFGRGLILQNVGKRRRQQEGSPTKRMGAMLGRSALLRAKLNVSSDRLSNPFGGN